MQSQSQLVFDMHSSIGKNTTGIQNKVHNSKIYIMGVETLHMDDILATN